MTKSSIPKISVILAVANGMPYLKGAVESILNQTYKNIELIIINDGSVDKTGKYLKGLKDKRVKVIANEKNLGLAASLNLGLKNATGQFIARMDSDDISSRFRLEKQLAFLVKNPKIDLCGSWASIIDENGKRIGTKKTPATHSQIIKSLDWCSPIIHPTFFAKREFYKKLGGYKEAFDFAEEYELLIRGKKNSIYANIAQTLLSFRIQKFRRSYTSISKISEADFRVKIENIKLYGMTLSRAAALFKQFLSTYLVPDVFKQRISTLFKRP